MKNNPVMTRYRATSCRIAFNKPDGAAVFLYWMRALTDSTSSDINSNHFANTNKSKRADTYKTTIHMEIMMMEGICIDAERRAVLKNIISGIIPGFLYARRAAHSHFAFHNLSIFPDQLSQKTTHSSTK